jgi:hypothetical protein
MFLHDYAYLLLLYPHQQGVDLTEIVFIGCQRASFFYRVL